MNLTRRQLLQHTAAMAAVAAVPLPALAARQAESERKGPRRSPSAPPITALALHRMAYGPSPWDLEHIRKIGFEAYVKEQLNPTDEDPRVAAKLAAIMLPIEYDFKGKKTKEDRPLKWLDADAKALWPLRKDENFHYEERLRPLREVQVATVVRAVYSQWQLREMLTAFWHNHFSLNAEVDDQRCRLLLPIYDRTVRKMAFGNFRELLETVATSGPMLYYLNNAKSKASPANENYARELFELHTLGKDAYYNHLYARWREVPGAAEGKPAGYIDQDVYEAARAFTGWTVADGDYGGRDREFLPDNGQFYYHDGWHDPYQKRVLGVEFEPSQAPLADGKKVLDLVAKHPATAKHICTKLCRRFVADDPPASLVDKAVRIWKANHDSPRQIALVMETILLSPEFKSTWGQKVKLPLESVASFARATNMDFNPNLTMNWLLMSMGQRLFSWPTPDGHPDRADWWLNTMGWLQRWNMPYVLMWDGSKLGKIPNPEVPADLKSWGHMASHFCDRMLGYQPPEATLALLTAGVGKGRENDIPKPDNPDTVNRARILQALIAMTPEFHLR